MFGCAGLEILNFVRQTLLNSLCPISVKRMVVGWTCQLLPLEPWLVAGAGVRSIELFYTGGDSWLDVVDGELLCSITLTLGDQVGR